MTNIKLNELQPDESKQPKDSQLVPGSELLVDEEGYLDNLSEDELNARGGADDISVSVGNDSGTVSIDNSGGVISISTR
ncbi:MAG TPA: hypothetical protein V6D50_02915 [Chroococcales cyanobacterium]|jgi:hypothetical protein